MSLGVYEAKHKVLREALHDAVLTAVDSGDVRNGIGSIQGRASSALYALLCDHKIDRHGRCRCCRRRGAVVVARRRTCRVFVTACFYLHQPDDVLLSHLGRKWNLHAPTSPRLADPDATQELPRVGADPVDPDTQRPHAPADSPPPASDDFPRARRPEPDHGGAGDPIPRRPRPRRAPSPDEQAPQNSGGSLVVTGGATWQP